MQSMYAWMVVLFAILGMIDFFDRNVVCFLLGAFAALFGPKSGRRDTQVIIRQHLTY